MPDSIPFNELANVAPPAGLKAGSQSLDRIFFYEYLRFALSRTIWGDSVESDIVYRSSTNGVSRVNPGWGYDPDLYRGDLYSRQVPVPRGSVNIFGINIPITGNMPHIQGEQGVFIPNEMYAEGKGAELFWDMISLFYDVHAVMPTTSTTNYQENYSVVEENDLAAYRFDNLPSRSVMKTLPANYDLNRIAGVVRLGGGTGNDSIQISVENSTGLTVDVKTQVLDLAEYTFDVPRDPTTSAVIQEIADVPLPEGITHDDVQSALSRSNKELDLGVLNRLAANDVASAVVQVSKDELREEYHLSESVSDLKDAVVLLNGVTTLTTAQQTMRQKLEDFSVRARELTGDDTAESEAEFSLDALNAILLDETFQSMVSSNVAGAAAAKTALEDMAEFITLVSVGNKLKTAGYSWTGDGALKIYQQNSPNMASRTATYTYMQEVWDGNTLNSANDFRTQDGNFAQRLDPYRDPDDSEPVPPLAVNDLTNARSTRSINDINFDIAGDPDRPQSMAANAPSTVGNKLEMEKAYVARVDNLDTSYYTYAYYGVDGSANRKLEMMAVRRLNDHLPDVQVAHRDKLENNVYLTESNWVAFAQAAGIASPGAFTEANVESLITNQFGQTLRPNRSASESLGVQMPIIDGLTFNNGDFANIQSIRDDAGFFIPSSVTVLRAINENITVPSSYVTGKTPDTNYQVTYDSIVGLNNRARKNAQGQFIDAAGNVVATPEFYDNYGLWFGSIEDVDLSFNGDSSDNAADRLTIDGTKFITDLTVELGGGDNVVSVAGVTSDNTVINTHGGVDDFTIHSLSGGLTINSGNADDRFTIHTLDGVADINATGGSHNFQVTQVTGDLDIDSRGGSDVINLGEISGNLTVESHGGGVDFDATTLGGQTIAIQTSGGEDDFDIGDITGNLTLNSSGGGVQLDVASIGGTANITTADGADNIDLGTVTGQLTLNSTGGNVVLNADLLGGVTNISTSGGGNNFDITEIQGQTTIDLQAGTNQNQVELHKVNGALNLTAVGSQHQFILHEGSGDATIQASGGSSDVTIHSLDGSLDFDTTGGFATVKIHSMEGDATIDTADFADSFVVDSILGNAIFSSAGGNDLFIIHHIGELPGASTTTTINAGDGDDTFCMNHVSEPDAGNACTVAPQDKDQTVGIAGTLNVHGQAGEDSYFIGLTGQFNSTINVEDKSPAADTSNDIMTIFGTNEADYLLFRPRKVSGKDAGTVAAIEVDDDREPVIGGKVERLNYDSDINAGFTVHGRDGDDWFIIDDNEATLTIYGNRGDDTFQVGQLFKSPRDAAAGLAPEDHFPTTLTTQGYLSNGISFPATLYGGDGEDTFNVNRNLAELSMFGENDNDTFVVRSFVALDPDDPKKPFTNINGGQGADFIAFTVNAPVNISGGDGLDTLTIIGTEFGDDFVVTDTGVYGAGRYISYAGVEKVVVDAMQGNDTFFIESTNENVDLEIVGGLGSDSFNVAGSNDKAVTVVSNDLKGHSGLITHTIDPTSDARYLGY